MKRVVQGELSEEAKGPQYDANLFRTREEAIRHVLALAAQATPSSERTSSSGRSNSGHQSKLGS